MSEKEQKNGEQKPENDKKAEPQDNLVQTQHSVVINGEQINYTVTTGTIVLREEEGNREKESEGFRAKAEIFFIAYTKDGVEDPAGP